MRGDHLFSLQEWGAMHGGQLVIEGDEFGSCEHKRDLE